MLIELHPSHLTNGTIFPLNHTILTKGFETRVVKFTAIVTTNSSNNISMSLVLQPQDQIPHKTKHLRLSAK
jgi:hypothetical protein